MHNNISEVNGEYRVLGVYFKFYIYALYQRPDSQKKMLIVKWNLFQYLLWSQNKR